MSTHPAEVTRARRLLVKVPEITVLFRVVKVLTTGMGEPASDWLARTIDPVLATFALGTAAGDMTTTTLHLGYLASGVLCAATIAVPAS